jgi:hypothetical protein
MSPHERVLLFTGHRLDAVGRTTPRFPPEAEETARRMIRDAVTSQLADTRGEAGQAARAPVRAICGGASGGDILFLEVCRDLAVPAELYLALPRDEYVEASVSDAAGDGDWVARFDALHRTLPTRVLSDDDVLPGWLREPSETYGLWQRNNLWMLASALDAVPDAGHLTLIALWNGAAGDGPGGTKHMLEIAREMGARTVVLDAQELVAGE